MRVRGLHRPLIRAVTVAAAVYIAAVVLLRTPVSGSWPALGWFAGGFFYTQFFEYFLHRVFMHRGVRAFEFVRRQHLRHHRVFAGERRQSRNPQDLREVTTSWPTFPVLFALHYALFWLFFPPAFAPAFFAGVTLHFIAYEALHWFTHVGDNALDRFLTRIPVVRVVRAHQIRHHLLHHAVPSVNFNFTPPYGGDACAGTLQAPGSSPPAGALAR
jgi:hypothetical protein